MNVLIISADNLYLTPYMNFYVDIFKELGFKYKVIYWDRHINEEIDNENYARYISRTNNRFGRLLAYWRFRNAIIKHIHRDKFDLIVPLHSSVAFLLGNILLKKYVKKYVYDVRDYSYEHFGIYRYVQKKLVNNSLMNIISSEGYKSFLPIASYFTVSNLPNVNYEKFQQRNNRKADTIKLGYIGLIRFMEQNKKIINFFGNDSRYHLFFIGTNATQLRDFCDEKKIENVTLIDTFDTSQTLQYYEQIDLIMNLYGNNTPLLDYALSNKLYYAAGLYKPILVCKETYMEKVAKEYQIGYTIEMKNVNEKDELYRYFKQLNRAEFIRNCDIFMRKTEEHQKQVKKQIEKIFKKAAENKLSYC